MKWSECIQEDVTLPADTLHLDKSDSSTDDKTCEDDEDAYVSSNVASISEIQADLFNSNEQLHNTEIASDEAMSDSETESVSQQQISTGDPSDSETNPSSSTPKRPCKSMMGLSTQTQDAQSSSHTFMNDSNTRNTKASQRANKRYKNRTHLISSSHSSKTSTPAASCR